MQYPWDPRLKSYKELKATEFISQKVVDQIMKSLNPDKKGKLTNQSWLIYGARGMGKSHALTLIYHKIKEDEKLSKKWIPILCPEELFTVNSLYRLFKKFASLIISELDCQKNIINCGKFKTEIEAIDKTKITGDAKQRKEQENELTEKYLNVFLELGKSVKRKFIFLIENLQEVFSKQITENDQKRLRDIFYQYPDLMIWIASAVQIPGKLADYGMPFYHFFRTRKLEGMNSDEIMKMLNNFCDIYNANKLKKNLKEMKSDISVFGLLSGGNPRLIIMLYKFLENGEVKGIKEMMKIFISDLTLYFQKETETLAHQQRLIIDSLCLHIFPLLSTKDIGESCNLPDNIVNAQVNKLKSTHWLRTEKVDKLKNDLFIMNEYIYRVWYQMRLGGIYQEKASWISEFLSFIYPAKKIQLKIGELENLTSKGELEDKVFIRSELEIFKKALEWQEKDDVKKYFEILKNKNLGTDEKPDKVMDNIINLFTAGKFKESLSLLEKYNKIIPKIFYYGTKGFINRELEKYSEAINSFSKVIELDSKDDIIYINRGICYTELNEYTKAIEDFNKAIKLKPEDAYTYYNRGICYDELKEYKKAIADYTKAIELNPEDDAAYYNRGNSYSNLKQYDEAIKDYTKAIELNPNDALTYNNRGNSYLTLKEYDKAIKNYTKAIELNPEYVFVYHNRGMSYAHLKKIDKFIKDFQLFTLKIEVFPIFIKPTYDFLYKFIADNFKVSDSIQNLFNKGISIGRILKHILILLHFKQNEVIKTYFSEKSWKILEDLKSPYPLVISFSALFNLIEAVSSTDSKYMEFASLWINIIKHIEFENENQREDIFNKSLMLIYAYAVKEKKSAEKTEQVLKLINKEYHPIAESHFYIPTALIDEKDPDVQRMMKDPIFKETVEKIKIQRENI
ncbi:MAG: tetratricopeptide repeat protein [Armatimonadetes bacterium]|nr:tetratricopeptide repeat protein [Armatimonadota bacterium]